MRSLLLPAGVFLLLSVAGMSPSSEAEESLFAHSTEQLERLWGGVLGCTHPEEDDTRPTFETTLENVGAPSAIDHDYAECSKRTLRNASSRMLVDAVEDVLQEGGLALFEEGFRIDSSIGWTVGENVRGELDAVLPLWSDTEAEGTGRVLFLQPGAVFWPGRAERERIDTNIGLVFRRSFSRDLVGGGFLFYDRNFEQGLARVGGGLDIQGGIFTGGLNYYHPLGGGWKEGRSGYEERAQRGMDLRIGLATEDVRFDGSMGLWRFKGEEDERSRWRGAYGIEGGVRVLPGVFLEAGYEYRNEGDSPGSRWNMGLAFRFDLPGLRGSGSSGRVVKPDLWRPVEREKRILYEERLAVPRVALTTEDVRVVEGGTATITGVIAKPLKQDAELHLVVHSTSTATHGPEGDFTLGHRVFEGETAPSGEAADCHALPCVMLLPAGTTMFEVSVDVLVDETNEVDEHIDLRAEFPAARAGAMRPSDMVRVTINAHDNTIAFGEDSQEVVEENGGTAEVVVDVQPPAPIPVVLNIAAVGGTATHQGEEADYILPPSVTIPAGQSSGTVVLRGRDDLEGEGSETVFLGLAAAGELPPGWVLQESATHTVTITDDDLAIGFAVPEREEAEPVSGATTFTVAVELTASPGEDVTVPIAVAERSKEFVPADVSYAPGSLTFAAGTADLLRDVTFTVRADAAAEADEVVRFLIGSDASYTRGANAFSVGQGTFDLVIPANDNVVRMGGLAGNSFEEGATMRLNLVSGDDHPAPDGGLPVAVTVTPRRVGSTAPALPGSASDEDISFIAEQIIPAGQTSAAFDIDVVNDAKGEIAESFEISIAEGANFPSAWGSVVNVPAAFSIPANDNTIGFAQSASRVVENVAGGVHNIAVVANLPLPMSAQPVTFNITTRGTAGKDTDYSLPGGTVVVNAGAESINIPVAIVNDSGLDAGETIELTLSPASNASLPEGWSLGTATHTVTIIDDEAPGGVFSFAAPVPGFPTAEPADGGTTDFTVGINAFGRLPDNDFTLVVAVDETAINFAEREKDYSVTQTLSSIPVSGTTVVDGVLTLNFSILPDDDTEPSETITLVLPTEQPGLAGTGWSVDAAGQTTHVITIPPNDAPTARTVTFSGAESSLAEGADYSAGGANKIRLTITPAPDEQTSIPVTVTGGKDKAAYVLTVESLSGGARYADGMVTFPANEGSVTFIVTPQEDEDADDELVTMTIGELPSNYSFGANRTWRVTIDDPDAANSVAFAPADVHFTANEGETLEIPVRLSENAAADLVFGWSVDKAGAVDAAGGEITIKAGSDSAILPVTIKEDDDPELDEEITVTLTDKDETDDYGVRSESGTHRFTVPANDNFVGFEEIADQAGTFGEADADATRDVRISVLQPLENDTDISLVLSGTATLVADYTFEVKSPPTAAHAGGRLTLPAGEGQIDLTVTVVDDEDNPVDFADEDIVFTLGDPEGNLPRGWTIDASSSIHTLTIVDDDDSAANTMGFATNSVITGETVRPDSCASFEDDENKNCVAVVFQINPGIDDADARGMLSLTASDGSAADTDDIYIFADEGDGSRLAATELVYQNTDGEGGGTEKTIYIHLADDDVPESTKVYTLTASNPPSTHRLVSPVFTITVTDDDIATVGFKEAASTGTESVNDSSMVEVALSAPAPEGGLVLDLALDDTTGSTSYNVVDASKAAYAQSSGLLTVNEGTESVTLAGTQTDDNDRLNNRYVFTLAEHNNSLPEGWVIDADRDAHTVTFTDTDPLEYTIGWEKTAVEAREDAGLVTVHLKLTDGAGGGVPFTGAIPELNLMTGPSDPADFAMIDIADAGAWTAGTGAIALTAGASYEDGLIGVDFAVTDDAFEEGTEIHEFTLAEVRFPPGWKVGEDNKTLAFKVIDDDISREGGNTVEFATASGNINEFNRQAITTRVVIDRPSKDGMKFLLNAGPPSHGAAAGGDDYELTVGSPAAYDAETGIVAVPAGTTGFDVSVAAESDSDDDDFEAVVFTLSEGADAMLPGGWRIGEQDAFTVTIFDNDGATRPAATLSQWLRDGANKGRYAQLSSTTAEGGTAFGAVYLTQAGPVFGGIPLVLTVEAGHEDDVTITNHEEKRSTLSKGAAEGQYNFVVKGGNVKGEPNIAALFKIEVEDDDMNEPVEIIDISVSEGEGFPDGWTLRDDVVYRLTVPRNAAESGGEVGFAAEGPSVNRAVLIEGQSGIERVIEASAPAPRGGLSVMWEATGTDVGDVISETSGTLTISEGRRRAVFSFDIIDNDDVSSEGAVVTFTLAGGNLPGGWEASTDAHTLTVTDDDLPRAIGGNTIEFAHAAANINEYGGQSVATKVLIDRPHKAEMKLLLAADAPASGLAAQESDYTFSVRSPASYDPDSDILTIPAETTGFEVEVAAVADEDDDFEAVALTLKESADANTGAQLPEGWSIGERSSFTVTIFDEDGLAQHPTASLSEWLPSGRNKGRYAQLSSTTAEGGTAPAAIALTEGSPGPDGLHFVLKVEEGYEDDVILADFGDERSTLVRGRARGEYLFHMTGGRADSFSENLAAVFNIHVVDDDENEPIEVVDISVSGGADFPGNWTVREDVSYRLTIPRDAGDSGGTLGFAPGGGTVNGATVVEGQSGVVRVIEASAPVPSDIILNWTATVATAPPSDAAPAPGDVISETSGTLTIYGGYRRAAFSFNAIDNAIVGLVEPVATFTLSADSLPEGWTLARPTHIMTIRDDDAARPGGNIVFFENAAANINEDGLQKVTTRIRIDRPGNEEMRFLLARGEAAAGIAAAGSGDYTFSVKSPAMHDRATDIVTVPPGTDGFELEVAARDDAIDDDSEVVVFKLLETEGAMLPEGWEIDDSRRRFTVTIIDDDGAGQRPSATLSEWQRAGSTKGLYAQLSSTTAEGETVQGAVYVTQAGPDPEGLNFLLTVEDGHALDVVLTDYGDTRSTLTASETTAGLYHFHMTGGNFGLGSGRPNIAALFNIHVREDVLREAEEVVDITLSAGENFPDDWTVRGDAVYRLTIPGEESNVRFRTPASTVREDRLEHSVQVEVRPPASEDLTFTITHAGTIGPGTASSGDYSLDSNTLTIKAGEGGGSFTVGITDDDETEADETIVLALSGKVPTGYRLDRSLHTLTIEDDDNNTVGFETASASAEEGEEVNLRIKLEDPAGAALASLDRNLPLSIVVDDGDDHDVAFAGRFTLLTPSSTLGDGVFEIASPVLAVADSEREEEETVIFTLNEGANFPDNFAIDFSADRFTLTIPANGHPEASIIQFARAEMAFREPYAGEATGVPQEIRDVLAGGCAGSNQHNCIVHYFDLEITGVPEEPFDLVIDKYKEAKGNALGGNFYIHEWGYPTRVNITPEDARDGLIRVPIATARDNDFEETEHWGLELRPHTLPEGWRLGRWDARVAFLDSTGGQVWFAPNDADNGGETLNPSIINEGETVKVRIAADRVEDIDTSLRVRIEGHNPDGSLTIHPDILGAPYDVTLERHKAWVEMEITARDDDIAEGDETYTLAINRGSGWQDHHGRRIDPARSRYTFTIPANDGPVPPAPGIAQLSEWTLDGEFRGMFAQLSSTTAEGGAAQGAVVLNMPAPDPDGLNFILKVEPGHEGDVFLANAESARSSLAAGDVPGEYRFNVKSGKVGGADNLAALFNIHVADDALAEDEEEIEISLLPGSRVPDYWTVRGEAPYRLTVPADANDTDSHAIAWETQTSVLGEDNTEAADGISVKLLIDGPLATGAAVGVAIPDTIAIADVANGSYDADAQALAINANAGEVTLTVVSTGDVTGHALAVLEMAELAGTGELPTGWSVGEGVHVVTIEDNERTLRFARSEAPAIGEGGDGAVELLVSPPLISADVSVPLLLVGDADAYRLPNVPSFARSTEEGEERNATAMVTSNRNADAGSIRITIESLADADRFDDPVTVAIDKDSLPEGYSLGAPSVATFTIIDNDKRVVTFVGEDGRTEENSGQAASIELQVSPPLEEGDIFVIPLKVAGDADAYALTGTATEGGRSYPLDGPTPSVVFLGPSNPFPFLPPPPPSTAPNSRTLAIMPPYSDNDLVFDVVRVEIDENRLPPGFKVGDKPSWRVEIPDDQLRRVSWHTDRVVIQEPEGGRADVKLSVRPPLPPGDYLSLNWHYRKKFLLGSIAGLFTATCSGNCVRVKLEEEILTGYGSITLRGSYLPHGYDGNSDTWAYWTTQDDGDPWSETITLTISNDELPPGWAIGKIPTVTLFIWP